MAEAVAQRRRPVYRFFCHMCNVEFENVVQDYTCPHCATGFIERLENEREGDSSTQNEDGEYSDAEMSNIDDTNNADDSLLEESMEDAQGPPVLNDLAFLMSGGRVRNPRRQDSLMDHFLWMIGGGRAGTGAVTAGAPFVLVGSPGDYVFGGEGLDAVVTQLLGQLENTGPPPLNRDQISAIPNQEITAEHTDANMSCSVCWDNFTLGETVSRLECEHIFHGACITPWLQLHATCPICRRSLLPTPAPTPAQPHAHAHAPDTHHTPAFSRVVVRRIGPRRRRATQTWESEGAAGAGAGGAGAGATGAGGLWAQLASSLAAAVESSSSSSLNSDRYMDIDFD